MADGTSFDGIFFVKSAPTIRFEDGLFFVDYDVGKVHCEFVMRPNVYLKAFKMAELAVAQFRGGKSSVVPMRRRKDAKPAH